MISDLFALSPDQQMDHLRRRDVMMAVFIDPHMSGMTGDVVEGKVTEG